MKQTFFIILILLPFFASSQQSFINKTVVNHIKKVLFVDDDTLNPYTMIIQQNGSVYFKNGFLDTADFEAKQLWISNDMEQMFCFTDVYEKSNDYNKIDTISNFFPNIEIFDEQEYMINQQAQYKYSYILKNIGEKPIMQDTINRVLRFIYSSGGYYDSCSTIGIIKINIDIPLMEEKLLFVKNAPIETIILRDTTYSMQKNLSKRLDKDLKNIDTSYICSSGGPYIIEYKDGGKYYLITASELCTLERIKNPKNITRKERKLSRNVLALILFIDHIRMSMPETQTK